MRGPLKSILKSQGSKGGFFSIYNNGMNGSRVSQFHNPTEDPKISTPTIKLNNFEFKRIKNRV